MRKALFVIACFCFASLACKAQTIPIPSNIALDKYGGRMDMPCTNSTGNFIVVKLQQRWGYCTPGVAGTGHFFISMNVANFGDQGSLQDCAGNASNESLWKTQKYGSGGTGIGSYTWQSLKRIVSWGFNSIGQDAGFTVRPDQCPCNNIGWPGSTVPLPLPETIEVKPMQDLSDNRNGYATNPEHDIIQTTDKNIWTNYRGDALFDTFDSDISLEFQNTINATTAIKNSATYALGVFTDDSDFYFGANYSSEFGLLLQTGLQINPNPAYTTFIAAPEETFIPSSTAGCSTSTTCHFVTTAPAILAKAQANNPLVCSIASPCSLRDYLWLKYGGNIASLNSSWSSNYTSFDSTGVLVSSEAISSNLANANVVPRSVYFIINSPDGKSTDVAGDEPWFDVSSASYGSPTTNNGTINQPWTWAQLASRRASNGHSPVHQGEIVTDSNGNIELATTSGTALIGGAQPSTWPSSGTNCNGSNSGADLTTDNAETWECLPGVTGTINYVTGALTSTVNGGTLPTGNTVTVRYKYNGWHTANGKGLTDDDGNSTSAEPTTGPCANQPSTCWLGTPKISSTCLENYAGIYSSCQAGAPTTGTCATSGPSQTLVCSANANANVAADLDGWIAQSISEFVGTMRADLKANSNLPYLGLDFFGGVVTASRFVLPGVGPNVDVAFVGSIDQNGTDPVGASQQMWQFTTQYLGDVGVGFQHQIHANPDSTYYCLASSTDTRTQAQVAQAYANLVNNTMLQPSFNGTYQGMLYDLWGWQDFQNVAQGLVSLHDNAYDQFEAQTASVTCDPTYTSLVGCGGEPDNPAPPCSAGCGAFPTTLGHTSGVGAVAATYFIKFAFVDAKGTTNSSAEATLAVAANNVLTATAPGIPPGYLGLNVYASTSSGTETLQNATPLTNGQVWTEPTSGVTTTGAPAPTSDTSNGIKYGNVIATIKAANFWWLNQIKPSGATPSTSAPR